MSSALDQAELEMINLETEALRNSLEKIEFLRVVSQNEMEILDAPEK